MMRTRWARGGLRAGGLLGLLCGAAACNQPVIKPVSGAPRLTAVQGAPDDHCMNQGVPQVQPVDPAACSGAVTTALTADDGGAMDGMPASDFGPTRFGTEADDDDCKYHLRWSFLQLSGSPALAIRVEVTSLQDGTPVRSAQPRLAATLDETHPAPTVGASREVSPGVYDIMPVFLDQAGVWVLRFHLFESCADSPATSPHAHAAFFLAVP